MLAGVVLFAVAGVVPGVAHAAKPVALTVKTYAYGSDAELAPLDDTFRQALVSTGWAVLESSPGHIVAKTIVRLKHYAKIDIAYGNGSMHVKLIESRELDQEECVYMEKTRGFRGPCVDPMYYEWLDRLFAALPEAHAQLNAAALRPAPVADANGEWSANDYNFYWLLTSGSSEVTAAARALRAGTAAQVMDVAAQVLADACDGKTALSEDAVSWLARGLATTGTVRHRAVIEKCDRASPSEKVQKYMGFAIQAMTAPADAWAPGTVDVAAIRKRAEEMRGSRKPDRETDAFYRLPFGAPAEQVYATLGYPDRVIAAHTPGRVNVAPARVRVEIATALLLAEYEGRGALQFAAPTDSAPNWVLEGVHYSPALEVLPVELRVLAVKQQLASFDSITAKRRVEVLKQAKIRDEASLDAIAQRVHELRHEDDRYVGQGLAWLAQILGKSGKGRYKAFLMDASRSAASHTLKRHAKEQAELLPDSNEPPFVPVAQAAASAPAQ